MAEARRAEGARADAAHALISTTCVNDCVFCATATQRAQAEFPQREEVLQFLRECAARGVAHLNFSGLGEPTLDPSFDAYLALAGSLGFRSICLFTNGYHLTPEKARAWRRQGLSDVLLSVHGMEPGHDRNVGRPGAFREAVQALEIFLGAGYGVAVNTCLTRHNLDEIPAVRGLLGRYPIKAHTLAFPEWSGNVPHHPEAQVTYDEVAERVPDLLPTDDGVTCFDNVPYCLVQRRTREMHGVSAMQFLDGRGARVLVPHAGKRFPERCQEARCPLLPVCPGFEARYLEAHGWGALPGRVDAFLDGLAADPGRVAALGAPAPRWSGSRSAASPEVHEPPDLSVVLRVTSRGAGPRPPATPDFDLALVADLHREVTNHARAAGLRRLHLCWSGGEPLVLGRDFFARAWELAGARDGVAVHHAIRTSLSGLDAGWLELLQRHAVTVHTWVDPFADGAEAADGGSRYAPWLDGFLALAGSDIEIVLEHAVTRGDAPRARELLAFYVNLRTLTRRPLAVRLTGLCPARCGRGSGDEAVLPPHESGEVVARLWEAWDHDGRRLSLAPFAGWERGAPGCELGGPGPGRVLTVDGRGDVFRCDRQVTAGGAPCGNVHRQRLAELIPGDPQPPECEAMKALLAQRGLAVGAMTLGGV